MEGLTISVAIGEPIRITDPQGHSVVVTVWPRGAKRLHVHVAGDRALRVSRPAQHERVEEEAGTPE